MTAHPSIVSLWGCVKYEKEDKRLTYVCLFVQKEVATQNIPISEARNQMTFPPEILTAESGAVAIARRG
jgi:hypothetical protein